MNNRRWAVVVGLFAFVCLLGRPALADTITNGSFGTGDLTGWTVFTTSNGTNGAGLPDVVSFNTTGSGATNSAQFEVGEISFDTTQQGGGLSQTIDISTAGTYDFSAAIAAQNVFGSGNAAAGIFSILIDGDTIATDNLGSINADSTLLGTLNGTDSLGVGDYTLAIEITRPYLSVNDLGQVTPYEYVTDIASNIVTSTPEPSSLALLGLALGALGIFGFVQRRFQKPAVQA